MGGLQVKSRDEWIDAEVIPDTILYVPLTCLAFSSRTPVCVLSYTHPFVCFRIKSALLGIFSGTDDQCESRRRPPILDQECPQIHHPPRSNTPRPTIQYSLFRGTRSRRGTSPAFTSMHCDALRYVCTSAADAAALPCILRRLISRFWHRLGRMGLLIRVARIRY